LRDVLSRHRILAGILGVILLALLAGSVHIAVQSWGPHRDYEIDRVLPAPGQWPAVGDLEVGTSVRDITPDLDEYDAWQDVDGDGRFDPGIDSYTDRNGNGRFDLVWLAGFGRDRAAQGVHTPLSARAMAFRNNGVTLVLVSLDSIGLTLDRYITVRKHVREILPDVDHILFAATHTHSAPDTLGLWSFGYLWNSRFDEAYLQRVQAQAKEAVLEAVADLRPARAILATAPVPRDNFTRDSRNPQVVDNQLPLAWFMEKEIGVSIGVLASWGMHPEALGSGSPWISADFAHYFREAMEKGLDGPGGFAGFGGDCVYFTGPVGGLMTQLGMDIVDRHGFRHTGNGIGMAMAQGENLAVLGAAALRGPGARPMEDPRLAFSARTLYLPTGWPIRAAVHLGMVHPGLYGAKVKSEVNALRIGEIEILATPGEIFPEIVYGGIETPQGADHAVSPQEVPPLFDRMKGTVRMNFNLANDEIGYIVPKSQWDRKAPYTYGRTSAPYGEIYTGSPEVAPRIHQASLDMLQRLHETLQD